MVFNYKAKKVRHKNERKYGMGPEQLEMILQAHGEWSQVPKTLQSRNQVINDTSDEDPIVKKATQKNKRKIRSSRA